MTNANYDLIGPLVYKQRCKTPPYRFKTHMGADQRWDGNLINKCMKEVYGAGFGMYVSEYTDKIEDFDGIRNKNGSFKLKNVFWDHVVFTKNGHVKLFESDDRSHSSREYCEMQGWDYDDIKRRDHIKDTWAQKLNYDLIRIPYYYTDQQRIELITKALQDD